jgi:hypothetical protein
VRRLRIKIPQHVKTFKAEISLHFKLKACLTCHKGLWGDGGVEPFIIKRDTEWNKRSASLHGPLMSGDRARVTYCAGG